MGYRTTVILLNDHAHSWANDAELGQKIHARMNYATGPSSDVQTFQTSFHGGRVVECAHADEQKLAVIDGYDMHAIAHSRWNAYEDTAEMKLRMLKEGAASLGYRLVKERKV